MKIQTIVLACSVVLALLAPTSSHAYVQWYSLPNPGGTPITPGTESDLGMVGGDGRMKIVVGRAPGANWGIAVYDAATGVLEFDHDLPSVAMAIYMADLDGDGVPEIIVLSDSRVTVFGHQPPVTAVVEEAPTTSSAIIARPNPSPSRVTVVFSLPAPGRAQVEVFDLAGRLVRRLADTAMETGQHSVEWDGRDDTGTRLHAGTYFYRLSVDGKQVATNKMIRLGS